MTIGRLTGDKVIQRFGRYPVMLTGALAAAAGMTLAVLLRRRLLAFCWWALAANTVPMLFNAAGNQQDMPANLAISAMTTLGYAGILSGPALIGFISQWLSLSGAFYLSPCCCWRLPPAPGWSRDNCRILRHLCCLINFR